MSWHDLNWYGVDDGDGRHSGSSGRGSSSSGDGGSRWGRWGNGSEGARHGRGSCGDGGDDKVGATGTEAASGVGEMTGTGAEGDSEAVGCDGSGLWGFGSLASSFFCSVARTSWRL